MTTPGSDVRLSYGTATDFSLDEVSPVDPRAWGFDGSASAAVNTAALQAAFDYAALLGSGGRAVYIPGGAYEIDDTIDNKGVPFYGDGPQRTKIFPNDNFPAFKISLKHGYLGGFSVDYVNVETLTDDAVCLKLYECEQCRIQNVNLWRAQYGIQVLSAYGQGYVWNLELAQIVTSGIKKYAFYFDSAEDSAVVRFQSCYVGTDDTSTSGGWYMRNVSSVTMSNCSMDGGSPSMNGSVINYDNGQNFTADVFHLEFFGMTTGSIDTVPLYIRAKTVNLNALLLVNNDVNVGGGNTGYWLRTAGENILIGNIPELGCTVTSGTRKFGYLGSPAGAVLSKSLHRADFTLSGASSNIFFMSDIYNVQSVKNYYGPPVSGVNNSGYSAILAFPPLYSTAGNAGLFIVKGNNPSLGYGWTDLIMVVTATNNDSSVAVVSSANVGSPPNRTYRFYNATPRIEMTTDSATGYTVTVAGFGLAADEI